MYEYDVVISGGGLVGGSLACALVGTPLRVALLEAVPTHAERPLEDDERIIALSWGSRRIFEAIGLWSGIAPASEPIRQVQVSDQGQFGVTRIDHRDEGVEALGYVAPARAMGIAIRDALGRASNVDFHCPARLMGQAPRDGWVDLEILRAGEMQQWRTRLLVAADGGESSIRQQLGLRVQEWSYDQDAIITTLRVDRPQRGVAFERFTPTGPLAFLPMTEGRYSVVWTCRTEESGAILALPDSEFLNRLQGRFGHRLGRLIQASPRRAYPLRLLLTEEPVQDRLVLIGNAAHTLHPVAGQGFNLGLRDVAALAEVVPRGRAAAGDPGDAAVLAEYRRWRGRDHSETAQLTDALVRLFGNPWPPLRLARGMGLLGLDLIPAARHRLTRRFMGLGGTLPRLARGLPLESTHD